MKNKILTFLLVCLANIFAYSQSCTINAGGNKAICGTTTTLSGSSSGTTGSPTWSLISKPAGATDPIITNANTFTPSISGLNSSGNYVFRISQTCSTGGTVTSDVTITAPGAITGFTAGADITTIPATTGVANLSGVVPAGYTASWSFYNLYSFQRFSTKVTTNATITNATTATPTLTLTNKSNHDIDPSYVAVLRITSITNPTCFYEDEVIVRFIPNPQIIVTSPTNYCVPPSGFFNLFLTAASPNFAIYPSVAPGASGTTTTTMTINMISKPVGGNDIGVNYLDDNLINLSGVNVTGTYKFTITVVNATGTYTTPEITFNYNGSQPRNVILTDPAYPDQMGVYFATGSAGAVYCNKAGTTDPIVVGFKIDPLDPATIITNFTNSGITPPGGSPTIVTAGSGTYNRTATITPPSGGWRVGTYKFNIDKSNGTCNASPQNYYIHISDSSRPAVNVNDIAVCYPGSGAVSATIGLPAIYKGVVNTSYFQDFGAHYDLTVVSKPVGSGTPTFEATNLRTITSTSTVIGNLTTQGAYVFRIRAIPTSGGVADFLGKEYACAGTSLEDTFTVNVTTQINSNAGSDFNIGGSTSTTLNGNNPTPSTGLWTVVSSPAGSTPTFVNAALYNTQVNGLTATGNYVFRWTISTGTCTSLDDVQVTVVTPLLDAVDDTFSSVAAGSTTATSVIANDKNITGGQAVIGTAEGHVSIATSGIWPAGFTLNANGTIALASTVIPGTYNMNYTICNQISGAPCNTATVAITVPIVPVPFECPGPNDFYLSQGLDISTGTLLQKIIRNDNPFVYVNIGNNAHGITYNALGYNVNDNLIYGMNQSGGNSNQLLILDSTGSIFNLGAVSGLPVGNYISGDMDGSNFLYIIQAGITNKMYKINVLTKTVVQIIILSQNIGTSDIALRKSDGLFYAVYVNTSNSSDPNQGKLFTINPATGAVNFIGNSNSLARFGAMYADSEGSIFGNENGGGFYQFDIDTGVRTLLSSSPVATVNDGAVCSAATLTLPADLQITKDDGKTTYEPGTLVTYTIVAKSVGKFGAANAIVVDNLPSGIPASNVTYTAVASTGSSTDIVGTQTGLINDVVSFAPGGSVTYTVNVLVPFAYTGNLVNTVTITPGVNTIDSNLANNTATDTNTQSVCYEPPTDLSSSVPVKHGITVMGRAGEDNGNWPMLRNSAYTVLESKTKGFVITRMTSDPTKTADANHINKITVPEIGMMVFDMYEDGGKGCLKIYTGTAWKCFNKQTCP